MAFTRAQVCVAELSVANNLSWTVTIIIYLSCTEVPKVKPEQCFKMCVFLFSGNYIKRTSVEF